MKSQWRVGRSVAGRSDGQRRWDYAYQSLLRWVMENSAGVAPAPSYLQEDRHGDCFVRSGLDQPPAADTDD
jgi:hypothetical protein